MRHGRERQSRLIDGYKRHVAADLDIELILACAVTPANRPEREATPQLEADLVAWKLQVGELQIDRAYPDSSQAPEGHSLESGRFKPIGALRSLPTLDAGQPSGSAGLTRPRRRKRLARWLGMYL